MKLVHRCRHEAEARIIMHALSEEGIRSMMGGGGTASVFPLPGFGPVIMVKEADFAKAQEIIRRLRQEAQLAEAGERYHDVDHKEIEYIKALKQGPERKTILWVVLLLFLLAIYIWYWDLLRL